MNGTVLEVSSCFLNVKDKSLIKVSVDASPVQQWKVDLWRACHAPLGILEVLL